MAKIIHSLRFQLPAVVLCVFVGILFLLILFFHEMTIILVKTRQLAESAEVNDYVSSWLTDLSSSARERTKLMSLGEESYLRSFQVSLDEINDLYRKLNEIGPDSTASSTCQLRDLHDKHAEYLELLDGFAKEQTAKLTLARSLAQAVAGRSGSKIKPAASGKHRANPSRITAVTRSGGKHSRIPRGGPSLRIAKRAPDPVKPIDLDTATNETFKAYENTLRDGLAQVQETMRAERRDKLISLKNSVGRAKDRLIYSLFLLLALVAYVAVILKWKVLDPMQSLKQGAVEIGKGALGFQVAVRSRNEMGELAEVFNHMSVQLNEKRNSEMRLKRLEAIEQIVRSVNHEINNPLMIISGNAEYLLAIMEGSEETVKAKLNSIVSEVRRIFIVTQRLKEIKEPITENYIGDSDQMIDLARSSQIVNRDFL